MQAVHHHLEGVIQPSRTDGIGIHHHEDADQSPALTTVCTTNDRTRVAVICPELRPLVQYGEDVHGVLIVGGRIPAPV